MPLGTLDRAPPPFFRQGQSALSKLMLFSALALFLMVADVRFKLTGPIRTAVATALYPVQWLVMRPIDMVRGGGAYFASLQSAQAAEVAAKKQLTAQAQRAAQVEQLNLENDRLRKLLALRERTTTPAQAAEVMYDAADPFTRRVMVDKGQMQGVKLGSPVMDDGGILGQVTRVYPLSSEVTLLIDREHAIPVLNTRTAPAVWCMAIPRCMAARWSCASWRAMPMYSKVICCQPVEWTAFIRRVFRWRGWKKWSGVRIRRLRASVASRWPIR